MRPVGEVTCGRIKGCGGGNDNRGKPLLARVRAGRLVPSGRDATHNLAAGARSDRRGVTRQSLGGPGTGRQCPLEISREFPDPCDLSRELHRISGRQGANALLADVGGGGAES